ncbi:hypothetical protein DFP92_11091 [Yoonia sediminilitoris]|uniref:Uncharacterized protein n=1 Tax=Yoonia sediminilitoris TaxID=1286148 RepID=A0A2T6KC68_9RHOB|nr:hypothetical protein C8N45_11091 [Yoonia sediminilitoris]RCW93146.1 hypothetical protein DFP92_11091 [Yoonia sediminilitoris]
MPATCCKLSHVNPAESAASKTTAKEERHDALNGASLIKINAISMQLGKLSSLLHNHKRGAR